MTRTGRGDEGQATVELALVLPLVAALLLLVLQVGLVLRDHLLVAHAAREAARAAAVADGDPSAAQRAATRAGDLDAGRMAVATRTVDGGARVAVHVTYQSPTDVPLVGLLLPDVRVSGDAVMQLETDGRPAPGGR